MTNIELKLFFVKLQIFNSHVCKWHVRDDMYIKAECFGCLLRQAHGLVEASPLADTKKVQAMQELLYIISSMDPTVPPPHFGREVHRSIREFLQDEDPFREIKEMSNKNAEELLPMAKEAIAEAEDSLKTALKIAIAGNIIDYGAPGSGSKEAIKESLKDALTWSPEEETYRHFKSDIQSAESILIVGDNAGEILLDKLFIEKLPKEKITYAVRGMPIINDSTIEDARHIGLTEEVHVITTGDDTPGVDPDRSSSEFMKAMAGADMIIFKGQGNFETMYQSDLSPFVTERAPHYFLFKVKCPPVAQAASKNVGDIAFIRD